MSLRLKNPKATEETRFEGTGVEYRGKMIGFEDIGDSRGDKLCSEALNRLKNKVKTAGAHKPKIIININKDGLTITDVISKEIIHDHDVRRISFISRDTTDNRAFGYIYSDTNGQHKFFAIKTALAAEFVVLTLRDLFAYVYKGQTSTGDAEIGTDEAEGTFATTFVNVSESDTAPANAFTDSLVPSVTDETEDPVYSVPYSHSSMPSSTDANVQIPKLDKPNAVKQSNLLDLEDNFNKPKESDDALTDFDSLFAALHDDKPSAKSSDDAFQSTPNAQPSNDLFATFATPPVSAAPSANPFSQADSTDLFSTLSFPPTNNVSSGFNSSLPPNFPPPSPFTSASSTNKSVTQTSPFPTGNLFSQSVQKPASVPSKSPFDDPFFNNTSSTQPAGSAWGPQARTVTGTAMPPQAWGASSTNQMPFMQPNSANNPFLVPTPIQPAVDEKQQPKLPKRPERVSKDTLFKDLVPTVKAAAPFIAPKDMFSDTNSTSKKSLFQLQEETKSDFVISEGATQPKLQDPFDFSMFGAASSKENTQEPLYATVAKPNKIDLL